MNRHLLVSDAHHFRVEHRINTWMDLDDQPDPCGADAEHRAIVEAHRAAGRTVEHLPSAPGEPDMVFIANTAVVHDGVAVLGVPPRERAGEIPHVRRWLDEHGYAVVESPVRFSGQGDALICGDVLLAGEGWRTDACVHPVLAEALGVRVVPVHTASEDYYDIDLALAVIDAGTLAWCPAAFDEPSRGRIRALEVELIEVGEDEARRFALNLVSDGATVVMPAGVPRFAAALRARGLALAELALPELAKGGGGIRCTALTLDG